MSKPPPPIHFNNLQRSSAAFEAAPSVPICLTDQRCESTMATKTKVNIDIDITPDMLAAGLQVLVDSGVLDRGAGKELPTGGDEVLVTDIYKAMVRARSGDAAVQVTVPGLIEPGAELVVKNEIDQPIRVVADPHETLKLKMRRP
jgi:hypothetical protein